VTYRLGSALFLVAMGAASALLSLFHTTALTLGAFGAFGVPCFIAAAWLYLSEVLRDLRRHDVL